MSAIESVEAALQQLEAAKRELTERQRFEMGWALDDAIRSTQSSLHALRNPMPDSFYA